MLRSGCARLTARRAARRVRCRALASGVTWARCSHRLAIYSEEKASETKASSMARATDAGASMSLKATMLRT
jgi:hypothetical protein